MQRYTVKQLQKMISSGEASSEEINEIYQTRIDEINPRINAYISKTNSSSGSKTKNTNDDKPLAGIPYAVKDIFCTDGIQTSCGSKMLEDFIPPYDATVVKKLKDSGVNLLGKTNMDEFAMGSSNETSFFGEVKNPWDTLKTPGGSSGGSAAAVAAGIAPIALGTDTGGSIRQPAAFTGITGLKPTYGRCSRYGMIAFASSLDQAGLLSITAEDAAIFLELMAGFDPNDSTSSAEEVPSYSKFINDDLSGKTVGLPKEFFDGSLEAKYQDLISECLKVYENMGVSFKEISLPNIKYSVPTYYVVAPAECSSNLARYDGVKYGFRSKGENLIDMYEKTRSEGFGNEVKRRILIGTYVLSSGYYDAYYLKAQKVRRLIKNDFNDAFQKIDAILTPSTPSSAFKIGEKSNDPVSMYLNDIFTVPVNLAGLPGISIPAGLDKKGYPLGLQIIGKSFDEQNILNIAYSMEDKINFKFNLKEWWIND